MYAVAGNCKKEHFAATHANQLTGHGDWLPQKKPRPSEVLFMLHLRKLFTNMKPVVVIEYCPKCGWLLRAAYMAQELLTTFTDDLKSVVLQPSEVSGDFHISINTKKIFDRKDFGGFPEIKELKQMVRDIVNPGKSLGHSDTKSHIKP